VGHSIGATGQSVGEVVFNTALTGYQEILTDPSYCQQLVTLTYPHIGNYGINREDVESDRVHAAGLIIKDLPMIASNFRSNEDLTSYLTRQGTVAIAGIDTRSLTKRLRTFGAQNGAILALPGGQILDAAGLKIASEKALAAARSAPSMSGLDLAQKVSITKSFQWTESEWVLGKGYGTPSDLKFHVVAYDFGVKRNIIKCLADRGAYVRVHPAKTSFEELLQFEPHGFFISNGPGDPASMDYAVDTVKKILDTKN
jgi:carbamoyl-phosphate synthase small subunit